MPTGATRAPSRRRPTRPTARSGTRTMPGSGTSRKRRACTRIRRQTATTESWAEPWIRQRPARSAAGSISLTEPVTESITPRTAGFTARTGTRSRSGLIRPNTRRPTRTIGARFTAPAAAGTASASGSATAGTCAKSPWSTGTRAAAGWAATAPMSGVRAPGIMRPSRTAARTR